MKKTTTTTDGRTGIKREDTPALDHIGYVQLSGTGRTVWWTGRVAIGLRYEQAHRSEWAAARPLPGESTFLQRA